MRCWGRGSCIRTVPWRKPLTTRRDQQRPLNRALGPINSARAWGFCLAGAAELSLAADGVLAARMAARSRPDAGAQCQK